MAKKKYLAVLQVAMNRKNEELNKLQKRILKPLIFFGMLLIIVKIVLKANDIYLISTSITLTKLTTVDYILALLAVMSVVFLIVNLILKNNYLFYISSFFLSIFTLLFGISGMFNNSSYLCYGLDSPLHDYLLPIVPTVPSDILQLGWSLRYLEYYGLTIIGGCFVLSLFAYLLTFYITPLLTLIMTWRFNRQERKN
ncbi:hypothetical protein RD055328_02520 [Companilactobacillus sp. RD055328]|uniref:hypothetical protein n=1 Tax=Companilactobacillus sp. RD055328 TaxID=2916634 RepID=UPI001FC8E856|nr:hypothetical protein [Companilactobacillus sp. RD055328]GKQ42329.1 hypothetical protein RD055328_02520 [Companilactobacillus sp. RD055328]